MALLVEFLPVLLFFVAYKLWGLMTATAVLIVATTVQVAVAWLRTRQVKWLQLVTAGAVLLFGGLTLALDSELFIKWKPTVAYWLFAFVFAASHVVGERPLVARVLTGITLPEPVWRRLSAMWVAFFAAAGALNLWVAYRFDTETWVTFKLVAAIALPLAFAVGLGFYISRHVQEAAP